jgi:protein involved in sex pheromone biosynthesis
MKKMLVVLLVSSVFVLEGCVAIVGNTGSQAKDSGSEVRVYHTSTMNDTDVVHNLSDQAKVDGYKAIAARRYLTQAERDYLVEAVKKDSLDQKQKDEILLVLLNNPTPSSDWSDVKTNKPKCSK